METAKPNLRKKERSSVGLMVGKRRVFHGLLRRSRTTDDSRGEEDI